MAESQNFITASLGENHDQFVRLIWSPSGDGLFKDAQVGCPVVPVRLERQSLVDQHDAAGVLDPREIAETFFESIPVPTKVTGKIQAACEDHQQITLAQQTGRNSDDARIGIRMQSRGVNKLEADGTR